MTINYGKARDLVAGVISTRGPLYARIGVAAALAGAVALAIAWGPRQDDTVRLAGDVYAAPEAEQPVADDVVYIDYTDDTDGAQPERAYPHLDSPAPDSSGLDSSDLDSPDLAGPNPADPDHTVSVLTGPDLTGPDLAKPHGVMVVAGSISGLYSNFLDIGYRLEDVRSGAYPVPRVYVKSIPADIRALQSVETRKRVFIKTMLPLILRVNEELRASRTRIQALSARLAEGGALDASERAWLDDQYARHGVQPGDIEVLLRRVDVIPPSLALAQAAEESGWGTSRFALEGRALFGQRTHPEAEGIIPTAYSADAGIKVKSFDALLDGVRSYARNLNTHAAYVEFRKKRADMRLMARSPVGLNSLQLVKTLTSYSERGQDYVDTIQTIIRVNDLRQLDGARLSDTVPKPRRQGA